MDYQAVYITFTESCMHWKNYSLPHSSGYHIIIQHGVWPGYPRPKNLIVSRRFPWPGRIEVGAVPLCPSVAATTLFIVFIILQWIAYRNKMAILLFHACWNLNC